MWLDFHTSFTLWTRRSTAEEAETLPPHLRDFYALTMYKVLQAKCTERSETTVNTFDKGFISRDMSGVNNEQVFLDLEGGSQNATLVVLLLVLGISSLKIP